MLQFCKLFSKATDSDRKLALKSFFFTFSHQTLNSNGRKSVYEIIRKLCRFKIFFNIEKKFGNSVERKSLQDFSNDIPAFVYSFLV